MVNHGMDSSVGAIGSSYCLRVSMLSIADMIAWYNSSNLLLQATNSSHRIYDAHCVEDRHQLCIRVLISSKRLRCLAAGYSIDPLFSEW